MLTRGELEDAALLAFGGQIKADLVHGFRIVRDRMQIAAVYWSRNAKNNDVEIAVCENRLTENYDIGYVIGWLDGQRERHSRECNEHKYGSDWPIFGLTFNEANEFLKGCQRLRKGYLTREELADLEKRRASSMLRATLAALRPSSSSAVIDLVAKAGISTKPWFTKQDGTPAKRPRSNPAYCYDWAFGEVGEPIAVCFWYASMAIKDGSIVVEQNILALAERLEEVTEDDEEEPENRLRARSQGERAKDLNAKLYRAWDHKLPIRVIVVDGQRRPAESLGRDSSTVALRSLDSNSWLVDSYDVKTGTVCVRRLDSFISAESTESGATIDAAADIEAEEVQAAQAEDADVAEAGQDEAGEMAAAESDAVHDFAQQSQSYVDQYTILNDIGANRREVTRSEYERSRPVRDAVLRRAGGSCELCGVRGFVLPTGALFLETHHVIPLCEEGKDNVHNVVALCPNDHREAHYGKRASQLRHQLLQRLARIYSTPGD